LQAQSTDASKETTMMKSTPKAQETTASMDSAMSRKKAEVQARFMREHDIRFDATNNEFTQSVSAGSQERVWAPTSVCGLGGVKQALAIQALYCVNHYGLRNSVAPMQWVTQDQIQIIDVERTRGRAFHEVASFSVVDRNDRAKVLTMGSIAYMKQPNIDGSSNLLYTEFKVKVGALQRISMGFPGVSFSAAFAGPQYEARETQIVREEMKDRGWMV
jgi:hypothetical protein